MGQARLWVSLGLMLCLIWSYWPTIAELVAFWRRNQDYSVGMLVLPAAAYLVWHRRHQLSWAHSNPSSWGLVALVLSQIVRFAALYYGYASAERVSLVLTISSGVLFLGGWAVFRQLLWVQAFLILLVPFPNRFHYLISPPLQNWATGMGRFALELSGFFVRQEGNVLHVEERATVAVAEACSGLRMLTAFVVTAAVVCLLVNRQTWQKAVLMISSVPIAVVCNGARVMATSLFAYYAGDPVLTGWFHDAAGLAMMPPAVLLLVAELKLLRWVSAPGGTKPSPPPATHLRKSNSRQSRQWANVH